MDPARAPGAPIPKNIGQTSDATRASTIPNNENDGLIWPRRPGAKSDRRSQITPEFSNELGSQLRVLDQPAAVMIHGVHHRVLVAARGEVVLDVPYAATAGVWELSRCSKNDVGTRSQRVPITNEPLVFLRDFVVGGAAGLPTDKLIDE